MKNQVAINEDVVWDNTLKLHEQSESAQEWYQDNVQSRLSYSAPTEVERNATNNLGLSGEKMDDQQEQVSPSAFDSFARPDRWELQIDGFLVKVRNIYMNQSVSWNLNYVEVHIEEVEDESAV